MIIAYQSCWYMIWLACNWAMCIKFADHLSRKMRKPVFCICENIRLQISFAVTTKLISSFVFTTRERTMPLLPKSRYSKTLTIFCSCTARFVLDLVGNPEDTLSQNEAHWPSDKGRLRLYTSCHPHKLQIGRMLVTWLL